MIHRSAGKITTEIFNTSTCLPLARGTTGKNSDVFEEGVRTVIKHREFSPLDAAHNARIDDET